MLERNLLACRDQCCLGWHSKYVFLFVVLRTCVANRTRKCAGFGASSAVEAGRAVLQLPGVAGAVECEMLYTSLQGLEGHGSLDSSVLYLVDKFWISHKTVIFRVPQACDFLFGYREYPQHILQFLTHLAWQHETMFLYNLECCSSTAYAICSVRFIFRHRSETSTLLKELIKK